jgi:two-component system phosphate regulon sensor histidine kinase PhoR
MRVVALNNSARGIFRAGGGDSALSPRRLSDLTRNPSVYSAFAAAVARGERAEVKVEIERGDARGTYDLHVAPLRQREAVYGSDVRGAVGVFFDITRLERLERVRQEFLSNVSHELRTPLTAIITFVETLEDVGADDRENTARFLSVIRRNAGRMNVLIKDILELSAIEAGTVAVEPAQVRLSSLVGECFTALASRADARGVKLMNDVSRDVFVRADARRLEQMLMNLVDNAVKYTREGTEVRVSHEREGARDRVHVADTGEGIAAEHLPRIFERFYRVDSARSRDMGGTGLGLAIVKHLARAHGGEATARSEPGRGSTFTLELPSAPEAQADART